MTVLPGMYATMECCHYFSVHWKATAERATDTQMVQRMVVVCKLRIYL